MSNMSKQRRHRIRHILARDDLTSFEREYADGWINGLIANFVFQTRNNGMVFYPADQSATLTPWAYR